MNWLRRVVNFFGGSGKRNLTVFNGATGGRLTIKEIDDSSPANTAE